MKNKTVIILLSVLAVMMYTVAVINFSLGYVLGGISDVLIACSDALMAYALYRFGQVGRMADKTLKMEEEIARLAEENAKLTAERDREAEQAKAFACHVTHDMKWLPTVEQIKSVYAAAGVMEQMNEHTDAKHLMSLWEDLKRIHSANSDAKKG